MILDALRRADAERERGSVPGLHAQPVAPVSVEPASQRPALRWHWIAIGVLGVVVAALAWLLAGREAARPVSAAAAPAAPVAAAAAAPAAITPPPADARWPVAEAAPWPQPEPRDASTKAAAPSARSDAKDSPSAAGAESPLYARAQLPEAVRAALPPLAFGGSMYSSNPANRTLIVNGGLYRENDQVAPELALEQIGQKAAVFRYKGYRFEVPY